MYLYQVTPYSTDDALRAFLMPDRTDGALRAFLAASFKHRTDVRLYRVKSVQQGRQAALLGLLGQQCRDDVAVGVVPRSGRKRAEADGALLLASSRTLYRKIW